MKKIVVASTFLGCLTIILASCSKESMSKTAGISGSQSPQTQAPGSETISVTVASGNTYTLNLGASSNANIVQQATHYQRSETIADKGDGGVIYQYIPELNYTGSDEVMISYKGSGTGSCAGISHQEGATSKYLTIKLNVTNQ